MSEEEGIKAIIFLQKIAGIEESEENARKNWRNFQQWEKDHTLRIYEIMKPTEVKMLT